MELGFINVRDFANESVEFSGQPKNGLALQSWGAVLALMPIFAVAFGYRIYVEEKLLTAELSDAYVLYTTRRNGSSPMFSDAVAVEFA